MKYVNTIFEKIKNFKKRTWLFIGIGIVIIIVLISIFSPNSANIATAEVERGDFIIDLVTQGEIDALNSTNVSLPRTRRRMSTKITDMIPEGEIVKKGDFLVQLDNSEALERLDDAKNKLEDAIAQLETEKATIASNMAQLESQLRSEEYNYQQAKLKLQMMKYEAEAKRQEYELEMKKAEVNLQQARERIKSQKIIDNAKLRRAELNVKQARSNVREAEKALEALTLRAPIGGLVVYKEIFTTSGLKKVQIGDTPFPGMPIIGIPDLSVMQAKTTVNEVDINKIEKGQNVVVTVDALEGRTYYGKITRVATLARREYSTNRKVFDVEVTIDSTDGELRPGMTCSCRIITGKIDDCLYIPLQSVFEKEGKTVVYVMGPRGPKKREVKVGKKSSNMIVVLEGLKEGEEVCLRDPTIPLEEIGGESTQQKTESKSKKKSSGTTNSVIRIIR